MQWDRSEILTVLTSPNFPIYFKAKDVQNFCEELYGYHICLQEAFYHIYYFVKVGTLIKASRGVFKLGLLNRDTSETKYRVEELKELKEQADNAKERLETLELELSIAKQIKAQTESAFHQAYQEFVAERMSQVNQELGNVEILILPTNDKCNLA